MEKGRGHEVVGALGNVFNQSLGLSTKRAKEPKVETVNVTTLMRAPGGGLREGPKQSRGPATSRARWR